MNKMTAVLMSAALLAPLSNAHAQEGKRPFNFNAPSVTGFGNAEVFITGGGTFDPVAGVVKAGGAFHVLRDITAGPLAGVRAGETVRWDSDVIVPSFAIRCNGAEAARTVTTDERTIIMNADVYRAGDGNQASLHVIMFVSADDQDGLLSGNQTVWIQGVGCSDALVNVH